jgi:hypothetical protein
MVNSGGAVDPTTLRRRCRLQRTTSMATASGAKDFLEKLGRPNLLTASSRGLRGPVHLAVPDEVYECTATGVYQSCRVKSLDVPEGSTSQ